MKRFHAAVGAVALVCALWAAPDDLLIVPGLSGRTGGRLIYAQRTEPRTLNPIFASDVGSREVFHRLFADLVHINRFTQKTELALAKSWRASRDGLQYQIELRRGIRFSDGHPFDADDVVFTFQVMLDEKVNSPQRSLLILNDKPIRVRKLDSHRVQFDLPSPYAAAERLFDGFFILPRHLLEQPYREGKLEQAWGLGSPPSAIAGLGPLRLKEYVAGQRIVLERNPYYWKTDAAGTRLPYLDELHFSLAATDDVQVLRFRAGESDIITRIGGKNFAALSRAGAQRGYVLHNAGPGFEYNFLFFNLNDVAANAPNATRQRQGWFRRKEFRQAISAAISREDMARLVYLGYGVPLSAPVPPGSKAWLNEKLPRPTRSIEQARQLLSTAGFAWSPDGALVDAQGTRVEFTIAVSATNSERQQMATLIQDDLKRVGIQVNIAALEFRSLLHRVQETFEYDAAILGVQGTDADPNVETSVWLTSGPNHFWNYRQQPPLPAWESEIDSLMRRQIAIPKYEERKRLFDRVQQLVMENLPLIPLVSPSVLVGAKKDLGNFRPALLDHNALWNFEELYWRNQRSGPAR